MLVIGLLLGGGIYFLLMLSLRGSASDRSPSMRSWGAVTRHSPDRQAAYILPAGADVEDHLALARYLMWQTGPGRDNLQALSVAGGGTGAWLLFATEHDLAGVVAGSLGLVLILTQVHLDRARRPHLIRRITIDERPRPTIRVLGQRPGRLPGSPSRRTAAAP